MKKLTIIIMFGMFVVGSLITPSKSLAITDPLNAPNNKFGIHINDENDLIDAANLVNSTGGDWGYVTLVIREDERDAVRWQRAFDKMRELHLIPIVRIATKQEEAGWAKGRQEEINNWLAFLNSLNWVSQNRYVVIGNEVNHSTEWGGEVNPEEYTEYLISFSQKLKEASPDYFILPAALDASAPTNEKYMDEEEYLSRMVKHNNDVFDFIDGWNSHSYPNPDFSGSPYDIGRYSINTYKWELELIKELGSGKELPVFITETGWVHDKNELSDYLTVEEVSKNYNEAFVNIWTDSKIVAITPFIINYPGEPFSRFSWKDANGNYYDIFNSVRSLEKTAGKPEQEIGAKIVWLIKSTFLSDDQKERGYAVVKNEGQAIWEGTLSVTDTEGKTLNIKHIQDKAILPGQTGFFSYDISNNFIGYNPLSSLLFN